MSEINKTQVIIIGAGPTGLSMAAQLIRHNIDFIIIDKKKETTSLSKAIVVQARSLEIFKELGIAEEAIKRGRITTHLNLFYKGVRKLNVNISGLGEGLTEFPFALSLEQSKTETLLFEYLQKKGKQVQWNSELIEFTQNEDKVFVNYKDENGIEQKIEAEYLVGCDGASSAVRHQLNFPFKGSTEPKLFYVADVVLYSSTINEDSLYMYMIKKGFVLFFPMEGASHYRIVGVLPEGTTIQNDYTFSDVEPFIREAIVSPVEFKELRWFSTYKVHSRKADFFSKRRCFIAGDAAHIHTPAGGQGMNTGIQDAYNLAWKIAYKIRGEVNQEVLNTYNTERSNNAKYLLQTTDRMFDIMSGVNRFWNFVRLSLFPLLVTIVSNSQLVRKKIFPLIGQVGIAYPDSYLTIKSSLGKVKAGDRMHYFVFSDGKSVFNYLTEPIFKLIFFGAEKINASIVNDINIKIRLLSFKEIPSSVFGKNSGFYILLRPDNHVSYIGKDFMKCSELINKISEK
jgi:2-polyprenyl-6-methoxyphenol hydroxylase-like FAD-dependent oxidoreductase